MNRQFTEKSPNDYAVYEMILNPPLKIKEMQMKILKYCFPWHGYNVRQMKKIIKSKAGESVGKR